MKIDWIFLISWLGVIASGVLCVLGLVWIVQHL